MILKLNIFLNHFLLIFTLASIYVACYASKRNKSYLSLALIPVSIYAFGYAFEILSTTIKQAEVWIRIEYLGIPFLGVFWMIMALDFTGNIKKVKKSTLILLCIIPLITLILNYTNDFHHLFYKKIYMDYHGVFPIVEIVRGPGYWLNIIYTYALMIAGLIIFIASYPKASLIIKKQTVMLMVAWVIPWVADIVHLLGLLSFNIDLCPIALSFSSIIYSFAILKFKLLKLELIGIEKVFFSMVDGVIIFDTENNIVSLNEAAKKIMPELKNINKGYGKADDLLKDYDVLLKALNNCSNNETSISIKNEDSLKYYKVNVNNIYENRIKANKKTIGKILILNDLTEIKLQQEQLSYSLQFLETLMNAIPNPIYSKDEERRYIQCNSAFLDFLGKKQEEIIGKTVYDVFEKSFANDYDTKDKNLINEKTTRVHESKLMNKDGTYHDVIFNNSVFLNEEDKVKGLVGVIVDVSEQKKDKEKIDKLLKLKESMLKIGYSINEIFNINELLQLILDEVISCIDARSSGSILLLDNDNNLKIAVYKGYHDEEVKHFFVKLQEHFARFNNGKDINKTVIFSNINENKKIKMLATSEGLKIRSSISSPIIINGELYGFLNIDSVYNNIFNEDHIELMEYMRDQVSIAITKQKLHEETLYLARYDKLTKVYNRSHLEQLVYDYIDDNRHDKKEFFTVVFDLNGLKTVNDKYGHLAGDELIKAFSEGLRNISKDSDIIGRFGGDEFIGIFFDWDLQGLIDEFEQLLEYFKIKPIIFETNQVVCKYSYGIVKFPSEGTEFKQLIKIADERMYKYKSLAKNKKYDETSKNPHNIL
ncbi:diguanylate cyclase [Clostridium sp. 19966]|nr:diguanylate cyclase [Clostridium sp. 19966]